MTELLKCRREIFFQIALDSFRENLGGFRATRWSTVVESKLELNCIDPARLMAAMRLNDVAAREARLFFAVVRIWKYFPFGIGKEPKETFFSAVCGLTETLTESGDGFSVSCSAVDGFGAGALSVDIEQQSSVILLKNLAAESSAGIVVAIVCGGSIGIFVRNFSRTIGIQVFAVG